MDPLAYIGLNDIHDYLDQRYHSSAVPRGHYTGLVSLADDSVLMSDA